MNYQPEKLSELWPEIWPLLVCHYVEIATFKDIPLTPDRQAYKALEDGGMLRTYTAREDGRLMGYAIYIVRRNIHYSTSVQAVQDVLYLDPDCRGKMLGAKLVKYSDDRLREEGVQIIYQHVKLAHDFGPLLERLGYAKIEHVYAKRLI